MKADHIYTPIRKEDISSENIEFSKDMLTLMYKIRMLEEKIGDLVEQGLVKCPCHLYIGQEAVAVGACKAIGKNDYVFSTHRSHGHYVAKGGNINTLMAEILGRENGCSAGRGGSMHLVDPDVGYMGSSAIVGGSIPLAVGASLAFSIKKEERVAIAFFGDGAATEGVLYESLNFAALMKLPTIFICENNFYSTHMHISAIQSNVNIYEKAAAFNLPSFRVDGNNVIEVYKTVRYLAEKAKAGAGPGFVECITYRWRGHVGPNWDLDKGLRSMEEVKVWIEKCPIRRLENALLENHILSFEEIEQIREMVRNEIELAIDYGIKSPYPQAKLDDSMQYSE